MSNPRVEEIGFASEIISRVESPIPTILFTEMARLTLAQKYLPLNNI